MEEKIIPIKGIAKIVGEKMLESTISFGQARQFLEVDMTEVEELKQSYINKGIKLIPTAIFAKAAAIAIEEFPEVNARLEGDSIIRYADVNTGIAVETPKGLLSVVLKEVQKKSLEQVNNELRNLLNKVKTNKLTLDDFSGSTITISSMTSLDADFFTSIVTNFEAEILSFAKTKKRVVVDEKDNIVIRPTCWVATNFNHSIISGVTSTKYLCAIGRILEHAGEHFNECPVT